MKKIVLYMLSIITTLSYAVWRIICTIPYDKSALELTFAFIFLLVEIAGFIESISSFRGMAQTEKPEIPIVPDEEFPDVDVFVSVSDEPIDIILKTVNGCLCMDYPDKSKVHIHLCSNRLRADIKALSESMNVGYLTYPVNSDGKAGCLNYALSVTSSPLVVTFNADMIPMSDFLTSLVPYFFLDRYKKADGRWIKLAKADESKKIGFVQCPLSTYNCDMFQYNLFSETTVPNEQYFFFKAMQMSGNSHNTVIYAGSNAVLSRQALEESGGFYEDAATKDIATGLNIQSKGYNCYAVEDIHASGLAPSKLDKLFDQREYWAKAYLHAIRQMSIFSNKNLSFYQKFSCIFGVLYWYKPLRQFVYMLVPLIISLLGITVFNFTLLQLTIFWLPYYIINSISLSSLSRRLRTKRLDNIYSTILFPHLLKSIFISVLGIKKSDKETRSKKLNTALPYISMLALSAVAAAVCVYRCIAVHEYYLIAIVIWLLSNIYDLLMAISFVNGRKYMRKSERFYASVPLAIKFSGRTINVTTQNISDGGAAFILKKPVYIPDNIIFDISITDEKGRYFCKMSGQVAHVSQIGDCWKYAVKFLNIDDENKLRLYNIVYDRVPTLPTSVSYGINIFKELKKNLFIRNKYDITSVRKLPRININKVFVTDKYYKVKIINFNYEYALLLSNIEMFEDRMQIILDEENDIYLDCALDSYAKSYNKNIRKYGLYHVNNFKELAFNEKFNKLLYSWADDYHAKHITPMYVWSKLTGQKNEFGEFKITRDEE